MTTIGPRLSNDDGDSNEKGKKKTTIHCEHKFLKVVSKINWNVILRGDRYLHVHNNRIPCTFYNEV